jgi:hypothetical protein
MRKRSPKSFVFEVSKGLVHPNQAQRTSGPLLGRCASIAPSADYCFVFCFSFSGLSARANGDSKDLLTHDTPHRRSGEKCHHHAQWQCGWRVVIQGTTANCMQTVPWPVCRPSPPETTTQVWHGVATCDTTRVPKAHVKGEAHTPSRRRRALLCKRVKGPP